MRLREDVLGPYKRNRWESIRSITGIHEVLKGDSYRPLFGLEEDRSVLGPDASGKEFYKVVHQLAISEHQVFRGDVKADHGQQEFVEGPVFSSRSVAESLASDKILEI